MDRQTSVSLDDHLANFVDEVVDKGIYASPSEAVRAGLLLLEEHETKVKALQDALRHGEESGPSVPFDRDAFLAEMHARHAKENN